MFAPAFGVRQSAGAFHCGGVVQRAGVFANHLGMYPLRRARQLDSKLDSWIAGSVKMTFDLPDDLVRELKIRAVNEGRTFKGLLAELFRIGLARSQKAAVATKRPNPSRTR